jgi:hypothetical protein
MPMVDFWFLTLIARRLSRVIVVARHVVSFVLGRDVCMAGRSYSIIEDFLCLHHGNGHNQMEHSISSV